MLSQAGPAELRGSYWRSPPDSCRASLTFENLCEQEENCRISTVKSSSLVSSSSSVSMWWYFSDRAADECFGIVWVTQRVSVFSRDNFTMTIWSTAALRFLEFVGVRLETQGWRWNVFKSSKGQGMSDNSHTIKITCVILRLQLGNKFRLLSQQTVPVQGAEEAMLLHFIGTTWKGSIARQTWEAAPSSQPKEAPSFTKHVKYLLAEK